MQLPPSLDSEQLLERLAYHLANAGDALNSYTRGHKVELGKRIDNLHTIYLDTNFWLWLRDTEIGRSRGPVHDDLHDLLNQLISSGLVICPISAYTWFEVNRQTDHQTRMATARLIDRLSQGVGIESLDRRMTLEILHFFRSGFDPQAELYTPKELVWTKAAYLLGNINPWTPALPPEQMLAIQKASFDMFWNVPLSDILNEVGAFQSDKQDWEKVASAQNVGKQEYPTSGRSFADVMIEEIGGLLAASTDLLTRLTAYLFTQMMGVKPNEDDLRRIEETNLLGTAIYQAFLHKRITTQLPAFRIMASLHAAVRLDTARKFKANDQYDFGHAASALPYCDAFFTEGPLRHLIINPPLALDGIYETTVLSDPADALKYLAELSRE